MTENASDWQTCNALDGFVESTPGDCETTSLKVFNLLNAMLAPTQDICIDAEDLRRVFGTASNPSVVIDGVWFPLENTFKVGSDAEKYLLRTCTALAILPIEEMPYKLLSQMRREIRKDLEQIEDFVCTAPHGLISHGSAYKSIIRVLLLVRSY